MDGNRRFARKQGISVYEGHVKGAETLEVIARHAQERGIAHVVVYALSTENWMRSEDEVRDLLAVLLHACTETFPRLADAHVRIRCIGNLAAFPKHIQEALEHIQKETEYATALTLWICLSYGGRAELVEAARTHAQKGLEWTEAAFADSLSTQGMPDPALVIRTGGDQRLSNFLLWQIAYSELFFTDILWPDFTKENFDTILELFTERQRRFGK
jgi:undecaprenyl diphosphate synthase